MLANLPITGSGVAIVEMVRGRSLHGRNYDKPLGGWDYAERGLQVGLDLLMLGAWARGFAGAKAGTRLTGARGNRSAAETGFLDDPWKIPEGAVIEEITYNGKQYKYVIDPRLAQGATTDGHGLVHIAPGEDVAKIFDHEIVHVWLTPNLYAKIGEETYTARQAFNSWGYNISHAIRLTEETAAHIHQAYAALRAAKYSRLGASLRSVPKALRMSWEYRFQDGSRLVNPGAFFEFAAYGVAVGMAAQYANQQGRRLFGVQ
jgi:hypothetical protein